VYTCLIVFIYLIDNTISNNMDPGEVPFLTAKTIAERTYGSKIVVLLELWMLATQWSCKACLLLTYNRLTYVLFFMRTKYLSNHCSFGLREQIAVKIAAGYVIVTGVTSIIFFFGVWCRPFSDYWKVVPLPSSMSKSLPL
jgi:hypothetical protein